MTKLDELRELMGSATQGPWGIAHGFVVQADSGPHHVICSVVNCAGDTVANQLFIVAMRNALPKPLAVVDAAIQFRDVYDSDSWQEYEPWREALRRNLRDSLAYQRAGA